MDLLPHPAVLRCGSRLVFARDRMRHPYGYERSGMLAYPHRRIMTAQPLLHPGPAASLSLAPGPDTAALQATLSAEKSGVFKLTL